MAKELTENLSNVMGFQLIGTMFVTLSLFFFGVFNDEIMFRLYQVILIIQASNVTPPWVESFVLSTQATILQIPVWIDSLFLILFVVFVVEIWVSSYYTRREGYVSTLGLLTLGILVGLLFMGIMTQMSSWFVDEFLALILPNLTYTTTWFNMYASNVLVINLFIIVVAIIINFVDFNFTSFNNRKQREIKTEEVV